MYNYNFLLTSQLQKYSLGCDTVATCTEPNSKHVSV